MNMDSDTASWIAHLPFRLVQGVTLRPPDPGAPFNDGTHAPVVHTGLVRVCFHEGWLLVENGAAYTAYPESRVSEVRVLGAP